LLEKLKYTNQDEVNNVLSVMVKKEPKVERDIWSTFSVNERKIFRDEFLFYNFMNCLEAQKLTCFYQFSNDFVKMAIVDYLNANKSDQRERNESGHKERRWWSWLSK
jgi:hypothetical protein